MCQNGLNTKTKMKKENITLRLFTNWRDILRELIAQWKENLNNNLRTKIVVITTETSIINNNWINNLTWENRRSHQSSHLCSKSSHKVSLEIQNPDEPVQTERS